jgi:hypothetical protein
MGRSPRRFLHIFVFMNLPGLPAWCLYNIAQLFVPGPLC